MAQGGPKPADYPQFNAWLAQIYSLWRNGGLAEAEMTDLRLAFGTALTAATMQGFAFCKPHGYGGDYEIIDNMYRCHISPDPAFANWDQYYHWGAAAKAVRNRKTYFHQRLDRASSCRSRLRVLKIASGPGRSMFEWLSANPNAPVTFQCVEIDPDAIRYAAELNHQFLDRITFTQKNALRYRPTEQYDLIWGAGIFDYFNDKVFLSLVGRLLPALAHDGELVLGNFSDQNPTRPYMEILHDWVLYHRSADDLRSLAQQCGAKPECITVGSEPEGVNLFLHISKRRAGQ